MKRPKCRAAHRCPHKPIVTCGGCRRVVCVHHSTKVCVDIDTGKQTAPFPKVPPRAAFVGTCSRCKRDRKGWSMDALLADLRAATERATC